jgi:hypothetical protein
MRKGWASWLAGTLLAIAAVSYLPAIFIASASAVPPLPWTFYAVYGTVAVVLGAAGTVLLVRGWNSLHQPPEAGLVV